MLTLGRAALWGAGGAVALAAAGCGSSGTYKNEPRPPAPIVVSASISGTHVSVSPDHFGAGPIDLVVTNQSGSAQRITIQTRGARPGFTQSSAPINPRDTAELKADLASGRYLVSASGGGIHSAHLHVGHQRPSAQNQLLQP